MLRGDRTRWVLGLQGAEFVGGNGFAVAVSLYLVFVAAALQRPPVAFNVKRYISMLKLSAPPRMDIGVAISAGFQDLGDVVIKIEFHGWINSGDFHFGVCVWFMIVRGLNPLGVF